MTKDDGRWTPIRFIEELSISAQPALETVFLDGWVLRFSDNYTRRANSVNPLYPGTCALDDNLADAEGLYRRRNQRVIFKLTPASLPAGLDQALAERGYEHDALTSVQTLDLAAHPPAAPGPTALRERLSDDWLAAAFELLFILKDYQPTLRQMLTRLAVPACFASLTAEGRVVSVGLGVLQSGWLGLFDIVTLPEFRGRGYGRQLINDLLAWAVAHSAHSAYLQVMLNNAPAVHLYERLGFREAYQYWYRVKA